MVVRWVERWVDCNEPGNTAIDYVTDECGRLFQPGSFKPVEPNRYARNQLYQQWHISKALWFDIDCMKKMAKHVGEGCYRTREDGSL